MHLCIIVCTLPSKFPYYFRETNRLGKRSCRKVYSRLAESAEDHECPRWVVTSLKLGKGQRDTLRRKPHWPIRRTEAVPCVRSPIHLQLFCVLEVGTRREGDHPHFTTDADGDGEAKCAANRAHCIAVTTYDGERANRRWFRCDWYARISYFARIALKASRPQGRRRRGQEPGRKDVAPPLVYSFAIPRPD